MTRNQIFQFFNVKFEQTHFDIYQIKCQKCTCHRLVACLCCSLFYWRIFVDVCDDKLADYDFVTPPGRSRRYRERTIDAIEYNWFNCLEDFFLCIDLKLGMTFSHLNNFNGFSTLNATDIVIRIILKCLSIVRHNIVFIIII